MRSVARIVEQLIETRPFLTEGLSRGIINNAALAEELRPHVEREMRQKVKFSTINMAIRRLSKRLESTVASEAVFDSTCDITLKSDLFAAAIHKEQQLQIQLHQLHDNLNLNTGDFFTLTQGVHEMLIITNEKHRTTVCDMLQGRIRYCSGQLAALTIRIPQEAINQPGLFYTASRALVWENINIVDIVSTYTELTLVFDERDVVAAFDCLKKLIMTHQKESNL